MCKSVACIKANKIMKLISHLSVLLELRLHASGKMKLDVVW